ncbi:MAG TPA: helicase HerA-like domain-containing protein, partial [Desulfurivibrionaceae bacterium]|nr:helicase HerA-like domain-containing protein [Desulfurivibrionaceae bacterium]
PKPLIDKVEQVARLIRSKGVGIYFITQSPLDIPEKILGQLGLKVQHALRAFTPGDRAVVRSVAQSFRANPGFDSETVVTELAIGEALVSVLDEKGIPLPVERTLIRPPESRIGPLTVEERRERLTRSPLKGRYEQPFDRDSAYELLQQRAVARQAEADRAAEKAEADSEARRQERSGPGRSREGLGEAFLKSATRAIGSQLGRQIIRGLMGSILGGRR